MKKKEVSEEDKNEFRQAMRNIKPLVHTKIIPARRIPKRRKIEPQEEKTFEFFDNESLPLVKGEDIIQYAKTGLQHKTLRKLRLGQYNIEAIMDLHGMNVDEAREKLAGFLLHCRQNNIRHVLIIHGKGHESAPILKNKVNHWLRQTNQVLAFCSATARQGRGGALYVLLKTQRGE